MLKQLRQILIGEKAPYIVALFVGAVGWAISHTAERLLSSPTVEYSVSYEPLGGSASTNRRRVTVHLHNLSSKETFRNATFVLRKVDKNSRLSFVSGRSVIVAYAPAWIDDNSPDEQEDAVQFVIRSIPPRADIDLHAEIHGTDNPVFQGRLADGSFRLVKCSIETLVVKHEFAAISGVLLVWLAALIFVYVYGASEGARPPQPAQAQESPSTQAPELGSGGKRK